MLDLGCGTGYLSSVLAQRLGPKGMVVAVDPDKESVKAARSEHGGSNVVFFEGCSKAIPPDQYDIVYSNYVLQWIHDKESAFRQVHKNLRTGGVFAFSAVEAQPSLLFQLSELMGPAKAGLINGRFSFVPCEAYVILANECRFKVTFMESAPTKAIFQSSTALIDWWFATLHGAFDPGLIERETLMRFIKVFGDKAVEFDIPVATLLLSKI